MEYLIKFSIVLFSLWLFYKLALENISWHHFKRFYLLGSLVVSAIIPVIVVRITQVEIPNLPLDPFISSTPQNTQDLIHASSIETSNESHFEWIHIVWVLYGVGVILMIYRFLKNLMSLKVSKNDTINTWNSIKIVRKKELDVPCSFLNRIYIPEGINVPEHILNHEKAHIDQRHSWDILFIETLLIVLWFHPLLYLYKYSIKLNHEFLADQAVLKNGFDLKVYQQSLLSYLERSKASALVHTYNFPIIKKRFTIMKTTTQTYLGILRILILIPVVAALVYSCGQEKEEAVIIDHSIKVAPENQENHVFGYDVNPYQKKGITVYNQVKYKYEIQDDFTVRLFTLNGKEIDQKLNKMEPFMKWDPKKEFDRLLRNPEKTEKAINDKKLIVQQSVKAMDTTSTTLKILTKDTMSLDQLKKIDPEKILLSKYFENGVEYINIMDIISLSAPSKNDIIYIDNNSPSGKITIQGKTYSYTNDESGIKIFDQNGEEINWYEKGWDIRERLVVPTKTEMDNLDIGQALKNGSKIYNNGKELAPSQYRKMVNFVSDSLRVKKENGINNYYFYDLRARGKEDWKNTKYFQQNKDNSIANNKKYPDTITYIKDLNKKDVKVPVIKVTRDYADQMQKNPVAATILRAMKLRYGNEAAYFLDGLETLPATIMLEASNELTLGFKVGKSEDGRPALFAAKDLPHTMEELQPMYGKLVAGIEDRANQKEYVIFDATGSTRK
ncbi:hypothetical protein BST97_13230 [Nonlabens spongiae]|uniref:Peptidase M56 domain-containing protein n=1 Tax=Nonlabens spongiae TaxID=331648 RepID=A0A1W6MMP4_9FLAO|nr:M56 family metallopeptidase [Nonlabens spongiae]ARN78873.1 hypothetical protein BST97_13230 [Nonlabens spongiae]